MDEKKLKKIIEEEIGNAIDEGLFDAAKRFTGLGTTSGTEELTMVWNAIMRDHAVMMKAAAEHNRDTHPANALQKISNAVNSITKLADRYASKIKEIISSQGKQAKDISDHMSAIKGAKGDRTMSLALQNIARGVNPEAAIAELKADVAKSLKRFTRELQASFQRSLAREADATKKKLALQAYNTFKNLGDMDTANVYLATYHAIAGHGQGRMRESTLNDLIHEEVDSVLNEFISGLVNKAKSAMGMGGEDKPSEPLFAKNYREAIDLANDIGEMDPSPRGKGFGTINLAFRRGSAKGDWASEGMIDLESKAAQLRGILDGIIESKKSFIEKAYDKGMDRVAVNQAVEDMYPPDNSQLARDFATVEQALGAYERNLRPYVRQSIAKYNEKLAPGYENKLKRERDRKLRAIKYDNDMAYARLLRLAAASGGKMIASSAGLREDEELEEAGSYTKTGRRSKTGEYDEHGRYVPQGRSLGSTPWSQQKAIDAEREAQFKANAAAGRERFKAAAKAEREAAKKAKRKKRK